MKRKLTQTKCNNTYTVSIPQDKNYYLKLHFYTNHCHEADLEICSNNNFNFYLYGYKLNKKDFPNIKQSLHKQIIFKHKHFHLYYDIKKILLSDKNINTIKNILIQIHGA